MGIVAVVDALIGVYSRTVPPAGVYDAWEGHDGGEQEKHMGLVRGLQKVQEARQAMRSGGGGSRNFRMKGGETAILRFIGNFESEEDPVLYVSHFVKRLPHGDQKHMCGTNADKPCVFCYAQSTGDKGIGGRADKGPNTAGFYVKDYRKQHKFDNEVRQLKPGVRVIPGKAVDPKNFEMTKYPWCTANKGRCQHCAAGNEARENGFMPWQLSVTFAEQLTGQQAAIRNYCRCGARTEDGEGTIYVTRYLCGNPDCGEEVEFYPENGLPTAPCAACGQVLPPQEEISCTNEEAHAEEAPARCDLQDFMWKVTRTGDDTNTTYNFEAIHPCKPMTAEEMEDAEKYKPKWEDFTAPEPPEVQAAKLGIGVPPHMMSQGHGARTYAQAGAPKQTAPRAAPQPAPQKPVAAARPPQMAPRPTFAAPTPQKQPSQAQRMVLGMRPKLQAPPKAPIRPGRPVVQPTEEEMTEFDYSDNGESDIPFDET